MLRETFLFFHPWRQGVGTCRGAGTDPSNRLAHPTRINTDPVVRSSESDVI